MVLHELMAAVVKLSGCHPDTPVERYSHSAEADAHEGGAGTDPVESVRLVQRVRFVKDWSFAVVGVTLAVKAGRVFDMADTLRWNPQPPPDTFERFDVIVIQ